MKYKNGRWFHLFAMITLMAISDSMRISPKFEINEHVRGLLPERSIFQTSGILIPSRRSVLGEKTTQTTTPTVVSLDFCRLTFCSGSRRCHFSDVKEQTACLNECLQNCYAIIERR